MSKAFTAADCDTQCVAWLSQRGIIHNDELAEFHRRIAEMAAKVERAAKREAKKGRAK